MGPADTKPALTPSRVYPDLARGGETTPTNAIVKSRFGDFERALTNVKGVCYHEVCPILVV